MATPRNSRRNPAAKPGADQAAATPAAGEREQLVVALIAGLGWLRTADRGVRQGGNGKWERVIETTGADDVDEDIYPSS